MEYVLHMVIQNLFKIPFLQKYSGVYIFMGLSILLMEWVLKFNKPFFDNN